MIFRIVFSVLFLTCVSSYAQDTMLFEFSLIQESIYDYDSKRFEPLEEFNKSGEIVFQLSENKVIIDAEGDENDKLLKIVEKEVTEVSEMYICAMGGQYYAIQISSDNKTLTLVSADYRFVYTMK